MINVSIEQLREWSRINHMAVMITPDGSIQTAAEGEEWEGRAPNLFMAAVGQCPGMPAGYVPLAEVLSRALDQAAIGKGRERHANGRAFVDQPMTIINELLGSEDGFLYQAIKKTIESKRLPPSRAVAELLGAINYLAGGVLYIERHQADAANDDQAQAAAKAHG